MNFRRPTRTFAVNALESLDQRIVPSGLGVSPKLAAQEALVTSLAGSDLGTVYSNYVNSGHKGSFQTSEAGTLTLKGTSVEVAVHFNGGNFKSLEKQLQNLGMKVVAASQKNAVVEGYLPIGNLPKAAVLNHETSLLPIYLPGATPTITAATTSSTTPTATLASALTTTPATATSATSTTSNTTSTTIPTSPVAVPVTTTVATSETANSSTSDTMPNVAAPLASVYQEYLAYVADGSQGTFSPSEAGVIKIMGTSVGVDLSVNGDPTAMAATFESLGMTVIATADPGQVGIIEGYLPIAQLPTVSATANVVGVAPIFNPTPFSSGMSAF